MSLAWSFAVNAEGISLTPAHFFGFSDITAPMVCTMRNRRIHQTAPGSWVKLGTLASGIAAKLKAAREGIESARAEAPASLAAGGDAAGEGGPTRREMSDRPRAARREGASGDSSAKSLRANSSLAGWVLISPRKGAHPSHASSPSLRLYSSMISSGLRVA